jgi:hypothetical protein
MLLTFDGCTIDGVFDIDGYIDISKETDDYVADAIYRRLKDLGDPLPPSRPLLRPTTSSEDKKSKTSVVLKDTFYSVLPWFIVVALVSYNFGVAVERYRTH